MTENKRYSHNYLGVISDNARYGINAMTTQEIVDRLNQLTEENQALKSDRVRYEEECRLDVFKELSEENEQLKRKNMIYEDKIRGLMK